MRLAVPSLVFALVAASSLSPLHAQKGKVPKRPELEAGADTNSAAAYYSFGMSRVEKDPRGAADAFYWATRLDPTWAQPLYARRIALLMTDPKFLLGYMYRRRSFVDSKQARSIDSLELRALMLNPFLLRELDKLFIVAFLRALYGRSPEDAYSTRFDYFAEQYLRNDASDRVRAELAVSERRLPDALDLYRRALSQGPPDEAAEIHVDRARAFYLLGNDDSTRAEMALALDQLRKRDQKDFVYVYQSKALLEHSIGLTFETKGNAEAAREAYGQALQEDLSYYPAHVRLGRLALATGDTATALSEMDLAAQLRGDDPWVQATYGATLAQAGRLADAVAHLRKATELEPFYPIPYYLLGRVVDMMGKPADAVEHYRAYVARASRRDPRLAEVQAHLAALAAFAREKP